MSNIYTHDPILDMSLNALDEPAGWNNFLHCHPNAMMELGFLVEVTQWNAADYSRFLSQVQHNIDAQYHFVVDDDLPCSWIYQNNSFYYTVWDCGSHYNSYKMQMTNQLLSALTNIRDVLRHDIL